MSVAVAIIGTDGIVVGADDCITMKAGYMLQHYGGARKIWPIKSKYRLLAVNTNEGFSRWLIETFTEYLDDIDKSYVALSHFTNTRKQAVKQISSFDAIQFELSAFINDMYQRFSLDTEKLKNTDMFDLSFTLVGYEQVKLNQYEPKITLLSTPNSFVPVVQLDYNVSGITSTGYYYMNKLKGYLFCDDEVRTPKVSVETLKRIVAVIIIETSKYTKHVSSNITMEVVTQDSIIPVTKEDIEIIKREIDGITSESDLMKAVGIK